MQHSLTQDAVEYQLITIDEIYGDLHHSATCHHAPLPARTLRQPIHPALREKALDLLRTGTPIALVRKACRDWARRKWGTQYGDGNYRFRVKNSDASALYRTLKQESGIYQKSEAHENLNSWFGPSGSHPNPLLAASCLYYQAEDADADKRFVCIISTPQQQEAAWRFGHKRQVLMDLTFGFSSARVLLAILMVIDDQSKGIPISMIMFSAKKEAKAVHADYNQDLLDNVLREWKLGMGTNDAGESFSPLVAITDNDVRERYALNKNFPGVILLLCMFHIWQAWKNAINRHLSGLAQSERAEVKDLLGGLCMRLLKDINNHATAREEYDKTIEELKRLGRRRRAGGNWKAQSNAGLAFMVYLESYIKNLDYWKSWSPAGAEEASRILGLPLYLIARTTNHLESFNGRIKLKYFLPYMHNGRLPRIDYWILILITQVLPDFFDEWGDNRGQLSHDFIMQYHIQPLEALPRDPSAGYPRKFSTPDGPKKAAKEWMAAIMGEASAPWTPRYEAWMRHQTTKAMERLEQEMLASLNDSQPLNEQPADSPYGIPVSASGLWLLSGRHASAHSTPQRKPMPQEKTPNK